MRVYICLLPYIKANKSTHRYMFQYEGAFTNVSVIVVIVEV